MGERRAPQARRLAAPLRGAENAPDLRVAFLNQFYVPDLSPTAHLVASLAEHRAALGDNVTVMTSRAGYAAHPGKVQGDGGVRVLRIWSTNLGSRSRLRRLVDWASFFVHAVVRTILLRRQDVIVSLTTPPFLALAGVLHKIVHPTTQLVLWNMDCYPEALERTGMIPAGGLIARTMRGLNRILFRRIDHLVALDPAMAHLLVSQYERAGRRTPCDVIPNWERADLFAAEPAIGSGDARPFTVLYLGNAGYGHEFKTMLGAAELLRNEPVNFRLVGGGAKRQWIEDERLGRRLQNVIFEDYVPKDQTPAVMRAADCALITLEDPMLGVMSPSKLHSNLAAGLPVIYVGPEGGNVDEAIRRFDCGISLRTGQSGQMAEFIRRLMRDPHAHARLRRRARLAFERGYCDAVALRQFDAVFASLSPMN